MLERYKHPRQTTAAAAPPKIRSAFRRVETSKTSPVVLCRHDLLRRLTLDPRDTAAPLAGKRRRRRRDGGHQLGTSSSPRGTAAMAAPPVRTCCPPRRYPPRGTGRALSKGLDVSYVRESGSMHALACECVSNAGSAHTRRPARCFCDVTHRFEMAIPWLSAEKRPEGLKASGQWRYTVDG